MPAYNEMLLDSGFTLPYFIWPNVDPFVSSTSYVRDVIPAGRVGSYENSGELGRARIAVKSCRVKGLGVFSRIEPLEFEAFELRFLPRRQPPSRWLIDLLQASALKLIPPHDCYMVSNHEDRLFIPLFERAGWTA
jgi:hypothetical protein